MNLFLTAVFKLRAIISETPENLIFTLKMSYPQDIFIIGKSKFLPPCLQGNTAEYAANPEVC
jgi:hypothetical protein